MQFNSRKEPVAATWGFRSVRFRFNDIFMFVFP